MEHTRHEALSLPNLITYFRLALIPLFVFFYFREQFGWALACLIVSALSDVADGYIARRFGMVTDLGKVIDPVADKLTQAAMFFCAAWRIPAMWALFALLAVKEIAMALWGFFALRRTGSVNSARWYGKVCTFVLYASMGLLVLMPDMPARWVTVILGACAGVMVMSLVLYSGWYIRYLRENAHLERQPVMEHDLIRSRASVILTEVIVVVLLIITALAVVFRKEITLEAIVGFTPSNLWLAALVFMGLFALKSLTSVVYIKLLYLAAGVVFPMPAALAVNLIGSLVELAIPFAIGRFGGRRASELMLQQRPKLRRISELRNKNNLWYALCLRATGVVPGDPLSIYLGACGMPFPDFALGSMLGLLPTLLIATVMGDQISDPTSPAFIVSTVLFIGVQAAAAVAFGIWVKKNSTSAPAEEKEADNIESA